MRLIDADVAKEQINQMESLKPSERILFRLALDRTPTYDPPNPPLTLEELREMDGEPVWVDGKCFVLDYIDSDDIGGNDIRYCMTDGTVFVWSVQKALYPAFYRRKPEEGTP